jgi:hypothetical protein
MAMKPSPTPMEHMNRPQVEPVRKPQADEDEEEISSAAASAFLKKYHEDDVRDGKIAYDDLD